MKLRSESNGATAFTLRLFAILAGAYVAGALVAQVAMVLDPDQSSLFLYRGPGKLMRRITMIIVVVALPLLLRRYSWKGWTDNGMQLEAGGHWPLKEWWIGFATGVGTLWLLMVPAVLQGYRHWDPDLAGWMLFFGVLGFLLRGVVVGLLEEILARGIFFRSLMRLWHFWPAALFSSLLFALGHFLKPQDGAFGGEAGVGWVLRPLGSMFEYMVSVNMIEWRVVNMTLMSLVLCFVVLRLKTVWLAAGLHAGWIVAKAINGKLFSTDSTIPYGVWMGRRSDFTDSVICTLMLSVLLIVFMRMRNRHARAVGDE